MRLMSYIYSVLTSLSGYIMKTKSSRLKGLLLVGIVALMSVSFSNPKITIYHMTGKGNWQMISVSVNALGGHANHGDLYTTTLCPVSGPENACREF